MVFHSGNASSIIPEYFGGAGVSRRSNSMVNWKLERRVSRNSLLFICLIVSPNRASATGDFRSHRWSKKRSALSRGFAGEVGKEKNPDIQ